MVSEQIQSMAAVLGVCVALAGTLGFVTVVDHDEHCAFEERVDGLDGETVRYYSELGPEERATVDGLLSDRTGTTTGAGCVGGVVEREGSYYRFDRWQTIDWSDSGTLSAVAASLSGVGITGVALRARLRGSGRLLPWE